ncbi:Flavodoxin domain [Corynebacterium kutscheri]|uniref:Flavodoxin domain n=1 Tax=Corynebacterium kutscheri TaxID=35755 RepID=A0A0F6TEI3_9CORY|nr:flavodoxin domain-containing protein [Corynebacterium kutscheri]AKE41774.1 Flavodoxin domain [Corynebacterium kutscheri]VEH09049.1 Flavodoxin domain [Corynebacterium kutscheri]VEH10100.1 Flavodoxin domain [Corynebacterium kutscheri]VEH80182.1 Flavodoxin domain [Corynebacterium kutscheri]
MNIAIRYQSFYGSTEKYAHELGRLLDCEPQPIGVDVAQTDTVIVLSPVHGPSIPAAAYAKKLSNQRIAVVAVGMTLLEVAKKKDQLANMVDSRCARFYLPGELSYSTMNAAHRATMAGVCAALKLKPHKTDNDRSMIAMYDQDTSRMDFSLLDEIVSWARTDSTFTHP